MNLFPVFRSIGPQLALPPNTFAVSRYRPTATQPVGAALSTQQ